MLYIGNNQSTEEFMVEDKDGTSCTYSAVAIKDTDQYQLEKKTTEKIFII